MLKPLLVGIWTAGLLLGSAMFFSSMSNTDPGSEESSRVLSLFDQVEFITIEPMSVAIIRENQVKGYLIVHAVFAMKKHELESFSLPVSYLLRDNITRSISRNKKIDVHRLDKFDLDEFQTRLLADINAKIGEKKVEEVLIQQIDFFSNEDIRDNQLRRS